MSDGRPFRVYRLEADSGKRYSVSLHSADFDAYLRLGRTVGGVTDYVATDDDGGDGTDALLSFRAANQGSYVVVVTSANDTSAKGGAFSLELSALSDRPPVIRPIAIGDSAAGSLVEESATWANTTFPYDLYTFRARRGMTIAVRLRTNGVRADAAVGRLENSKFVVVAGSGVSLFRRFTPTEDGEYAVKVMAVGPSRYVLHVDERGLDQPRVVEVGKILTGVLDPRSGNEARPFHNWSLSAQQGDRLAISLRSSDFDTNLFLARRQGDSLARVAANDDAPGQGKNSLIALTVATAGQYVIQVQSADSMGGDYSLRVDTLGRVVQHLQRERILPGREVSGILSPTDSLLEDGSPYQEWIYRVTRPNERVMFTMRSADFDTFLSVGRREDGKFVEFSSNDDAREDSRRNHVSRVLIVAPSAGDFVVRANSMAANESGAYRLWAGAPELEERASRMAARADSLARQGRIADAITLIDSALVADSSTVTSSQLNSVCWFGTLRSFAPRVLRYCERAVRLDPGATGIVDSRGVARALAGDVPGAIQDFRAYVGDPANDAASRSQRRAWMEALQAGTSPQQVFSEAVRTDLLKQ